MKEAPRPSEARPDDTGGQGKKKRRRQVRSDEQRWDTKMARWAKKLTGQEQAENLAREVGRRPYTEKHIVSGTKPLEQPHGNFSPDSPLNRKGHILPGWKSPDHAIADHPPYRRRDAPAHLQKQYDPKDENAY